MKAVGGQDEKEDNEIVWWEPKVRMESDEESEAEEEEKHPMKWWVDEKKGSSRGGLRDDPQKEKGKDRRIVQKNTKVHTPTPLRGGHCVETLRVLPLAANRNLAAKGSARRAHRRCVRRSLGGFGRSAGAGWASASPPACRPSPGRCRRTTGGRH